MIEFLADFLTLFGVVAGLGALWEFLIIGAIEEWRNEK